MIRISVEYRTVEEALLALGKLADITPQRAFTAPAIVQGAEDKAPETDKPRRGRPRKNANPAVEAGGVTGKVGAEGSGAAVTDSRKADEAVTGKSTPAASALAPKTAASQTSPSGPDKGAPTGAVLPVTAAASTVKLEDAQVGLEKVFNAKGIQVAQALLARFGIKRVRELKPEQYAEFVIDTGRVERGEYNPFATT